MLSPLTNVTPNWRDIRITVPPDDRVDEEYEVAYEEPSDVEDGASITGSQMHGEG
jgi:hypothetical protein